MLSYENSWFQASAVIRWDLHPFRIERRVVLIPYRRFGTTYRSHIQRSRSLSSGVKNSKNKISWILKMRPRVFPETSVRNYVSTLCNIHRTNTLLSAVRKAHGKLECRYSSSQPTHRFLLMYSPLVYGVCQPSQSLSVSVCLWTVQSGWKNGRADGEVPCWEEHNALSEIRGSHSMGLLGAIRIFSNQIQGVTIRVKYLCWYAKIPW
jgi:hypothetical protein